MQVCMCMRLCLCNVAVPVVVVRLPLRVLGVVSEHRVLCVSVLVMLYDVSVFDEVPLRCY